MKKLVTAVIILTICTSIVFAQSITANIDVVFNKVNIAVNGTKVESNNILYEGTTYVPLRAVAEMLGKDVTWNQETSTAGINDKNTNDAGDGFIYGNVSFKDGAIGYSYIIGEMTNYSLKDYNSVSFTISTYDEIGTLLQTDNIYISNLKSKDTKAFEGMIEIDDVSKIKTYKIKFNSGY